LDADRHPESLWAFFWVFGFPDTGRGAWRSGFLTIRSPLSGKFVDYFFNFSHCILKKKAPVNIDAV
jgi:hypothetical protein